MTNTKLRSIFSNTYWRIGAGVVAVILIGIFVWQGFREPESSLISDTPVMMQSTVEVIPDKASAVSIMNGKVEVKIPEEAVDSQGFINLVLREPDLFPEAGEPGWSRPYIVNVEFLDSEGNQAPSPPLMSPVEICFELDDEEWDFCQTAAEGETMCKVQNYDNVAVPSVWVDLPKLVYKSKQMICGETTHLSLFALAMKGFEVPIPVTGGEEPYSP